MASLREFVEAGSLMFYGTSFAGQYWRGAMHVDRILRGTRPVDLPIGQPAWFELVIKARTVKALGLPPTLLAFADQVIERSLDRRVG